MKILYGVVGEGMGHAIRSKVVIDHLIKDENHEVQVVVSGRAYNVLSDYFPGVHKIWGLSMSYKENEFNVIKSVVQNIKKALDSGLPDNIRQYFELTAEFKPDCVISDFESWSYLYGMRHQIPVIGIDNIHMVSRCRHPEELLKIHKGNYEISKNFTKGKTPRSTHYYIPTFFYPEVRKQRTTLVPSILRNEILEAKKTVKDHIVVYQTSESCADLPEILKKIDKPFFVYGFKREIKEVVKENNITYKPFSEKGLVRDLSSAFGVIANGGFTLLSESVYLQKPILSIPIQSQFEQVLNAHYLEELGFGYSMDKLDKETILYFIEHIDNYRDNLSKYKQEEGNGILFNLLDEQLDTISAGL